MNPILAALDKLTPGWKTGIGAGGLVVTAAVHFALFFTGNLGPPMDGFVEGGYTIFGSLTGLGLVVKLAKIEAAQTPPQ